MSRDNVTLSDVLDGLVDSHKITQETAGHAKLMLQQKAAVQPSYVRAMVGFGAWLASLLLIGFFVGLFADMGEFGFIVVGLVLVAGAALFRRTSDGDFVVQSTLAVSLAGQALASVSAVILLDGENVEVVLVAVVIVSAVLFMVFPDRIHRVFSVLLALGSLVILIYVQELNALIPVVGPAVAVAFVLLHERQGELYERGIGELVQPLRSGLMLGAFGCLLLSTVYLLPELIGVYGFYPRPWISTLLLGGLFLYVCNRIWLPNVEGVGDVGLAIVYGLLVTVIVAAWSAPGLLLALIVIVIGTASGNRSMMGAGAVFLVVFVSAYFYGIQLTMLAKSVSLVSSGVAILLARWVLLRVIEPSAGEEASHE